MPTRNVNLTDELDRFVREKVKSGRYENASEVVRSALRSLDHEERHFEAKLIALRSAIDQGDASGIAKGDVFAAARLAGIMAAKKTGELIPLCHPLALDSVAVDFQLEPRRIRITAAAAISAKTGVEMEALTAVAVAALTIYDMCKGIDRRMVIGEIRLLSKTGGSKS